MAPLTFELRRGAPFFPELNLWLDPHHAVGPDHLAFVSHAHADHSARHAHLLCTPATRELLAIRLPGKREEIVLDFHLPTSLAQLLWKATSDVPDVRITLLPAGHVLGSAMILMESGLGSLLYTGDFKLKPGRKSEHCHPHPADVLLMETTFGKAQYTLPPIESVLEDILSFCRETLAQNQTPVLLAYSLGKAQELLGLLHGACLPIRLTRHVKQITRVYESFGFTFPDYSKWSSGDNRGHVIIAPPSVKRESLRQDLYPARFAMVTGWALDSSARYRLGTDEVFPVSDHADFPDLVELVQQVRPKHVYTMHGFADEFAAHLRSLNYQSTSLSKQKQMQLALDDASTIRPPRRR